MTANLNPYLSFGDNAREAMEFYQSVFGGELTLTTFGEAGGMGMPEEEQGKVMHGQLEVKDVLLLMGADTPAYLGERPTPAGITVSLSGDDADTLRGWWEGLSDGAEIGEKLAKAPWGDEFGMLTDKFGVPWLVNITGAATDGA